MKTIAILIILTVLTYSGHAQDFFEAGPKVGLNSSKMSVKVSDYTPQTINNYLFGGYARLSFGRIYFQPEAYFNSKGGEVINKITISTINSFDLKTVDVPALLGLKIINQDAFNLRIMAGPVFSFVTDKSTDGAFSTDKLRDNIFGWQYGAGIDVLFLTLDARMESYGKNLYDDPNFGSKKGTFVISLGIKLF